MCRSRTTSELNSSPSALSSAGSRCGLAHGRLCQALSCRVGSSELSRRRRATTPRQLNGDSSPVTTLLPSANSPHHCELSTTGHWPRCTAASLPTGTSMDTRPPTATSVTPLGCGGCRRHNSSASPSSAAWSVGRANLHDAHEGASVLTATECSSHSPCPNRRARANVGLQQERGASDRGSKQLQSNLADGQASRPQGRPRRIAPTACRTGPSNSSTRRA